MNKIMFLISGWILTPILAENPSWYPDNVHEISKTCNDEHQFDDNRLIDSPNLRAALLCKAKRINVYNEDTGLNVDRLVYFYHRLTNKLNCKKSFVQACADEYKDVASDGEKIFKVVKCISDKDFEEEERAKTSGLNTC